MKALFAIIARLFALSARPVGMEMPHVHTPFIAFRPSRKSGAAVIKRAAIKRRNRRLHRA